MAKVKIIRSNLYCLAIWSDEESKSVVLGAPKFDKDDGNGSIVHSLRECYNCSWTILMSSGDEPRSHPWTSFTLQDLIFKNFG